MTKVDASYTKASSPNGTRFTIVPATSPDAGFSLARLFLSTIPAWVFSALVAGLAGAVVSSVVGADNLGSAAGVAIVGVAWIGFFFGWYKSYRWFSRWLLAKQAKGRHAYRTELLVNGSGITVAGTGQFVRREDIHRFVLKNAFDESVEVPLVGYVAVGSPMAVGVGAAAGAIGNSMAMLVNHKRRNMARVSYIVTAEAGGVSHPIAGGLSEVCAHGLMTDVGRALTQ